MVTPAQAAQNPVTGPAEPVPVAVLTRTSTRDMQDPVASYRRQVRSCQQWLPAGWHIVAVYSDVASGGTDLEDRSQASAHDAITRAGLPRDGGIADLLAEAASPAPRFAVVVCEDIERAGRDTYNALKLEKELSRNGIAIFATDEPADIAGVSATAILVRRVKQGVAEWYRLKLKGDIWKGLVEHSAEGWNIGTPPYGYAAERVTHPNPLKASQGHTKTRLILDPAAAPVVAQIFTWRVVHKLGLPAIAKRLNADTALYPPPGAAAAWTQSTVYTILKNPKYTGHMVFGRRRSDGNGHKIHVPAGQWLWSPEPTHPAIVDPGTWQEAQGIGALHGTSRDDDESAAPFTTTRSYAYRARVLCRDCRRRMAGTAKGSTAQHVYYRCPHDPANPRHAAAQPDHPRTVQAPQNRLDAIVGRFLTDHIFGPQRAANLAAQLPATDADAQTRRDADTAALTARIKQLDTAQNAQIKALEAIPADPDSPAAAAMRARIRDRFAELHDQRQQAETQLAALTTATPKAADPDLIDELPYLGDVLPDLPDHLKARLFAAFDLTILWNKTMGQATVNVEITDATLQALPAIIDPSQDGYHDTAASTPASPAPVGDLSEPTRACQDA